MATITHYVSQGIQAGQPLALKTHRVFWRTVGRGTANAVSDFEMEVDGRVELKVYQGDLQIHIALLDQDEAATAGPCLLRVNSLSDDKASYRTHGDGLTISAVMSGKEVQVRFSRSQPNNMTECKVSAPYDLTVYIEPTAA